MGQPDQRSDRDFELYLNIGVTKMDLTSHRSLFSNVVQIFENYDLPSEPQTLYPANILFGFTTLYRISGSAISFGLDGRYSRTNAYLAYTDAAGRYDVSSRVTMATVAAVARYSFEVNSKFTPYVSLMPGIAFASSDLVSDVRFSAFRPSFEQGGFETSRHATSSAEVAVGVRRTFASLPAKLEFSYRFATVAQVEIEDMEVLLPHDLSGVTLSVGVGI